MEFDLTTLIYEIKLRKPLWQKRSYRLYGRHFIHKLWLEVADIMGVNKELVRSKWKGLRDNFRSELRKIPKKPEERHYGYHSKWIYFNDMMFLKDQMTSINKADDVLSSLVDIDRTLSYDYCNGIVSGDVEDVNIDVDVYPLNNIEDVSDSGDRQNQNNFKTDFSQYRSITIDDLSFETNTVPSIYNIDDYNNVNNNFRLCKNYGGKSSCDTFDIWIDKNKKLKFNRDDSEFFNEISDDFYFLMSFLPSIKSLTPVKKMSLRFKLQKLIFDEVYNKKGKLNDKTVR